MVRSWTIALGLGLLILWLAGLGSPLAAGWLTWLDFLAALLAFHLARARLFRDGSDTAPSAPFLEAVFLAALWFISFSTPTAAWLRWLTFAFALAFLLLGCAALNHRNVRRNADYW